MFILHLQEYGYDIFEGILHMKHKIVSSDKFIIQSIKYDIF